MDTITNDAHNPIEVELHPLSDLIRALITFKGRSVLTIPAQNQDATIKDRGFEVCGLYAIVEYLNERYPGPDFFHAEPFQRAIARMEFATLVHYIYTDNNNEWRSAYSEHLRARTTRCLVSDMPCILDVVLITTITDDMPHIWHKYKDAVLKAYI